MLLIELPSNPLHASHGVCEDLWPRVPLSCGQPDDCSIAFALRRHNQRWVPGVSPLNVGAVGKICVIVLLHVNTKSAEAAIIEQHARPTGVLLEVRVAITGHLIHRIFGSGACCDGCTLLRSRSQLLAEACDQSGCVGCVRVKFCCAYAYHIPEKTLSVTIFQEKPFRNRDATPTNQEGFQNKCRKMAKAG